MRESSYLFSKFDHLKSLNHENICKYIEIIPFELQQNNFIILSEFYNENLEDIILYRREPFNEIELIQIAR
jgi:hypothetical protein